MGSDLSYEDMLDDRKLTESYDAVVIAEEEYGGTSCWVIELNAINPQVAARMAGAFNRWKRYDENRQRLMRTQLERIANEENLSRDVSEIVNNALR